MIVLPVLVYLSMIIETGFNQKMPCSHIKSTGGMESRIGNSKEDSETNILMIFCSTILFITILMNKRLSPGNLDIMCTFKTEKRYTSKDKPDSRPFFPF